MDLLLGDDEVVALALETGRPWPTALPTVDVEAEPSLLAAGLRGLRSLAVRGLIGEGTAPDPRFDAVRRQVPGASGRLSMFLADVDGNRAGSALNLNAYSAGDGWLIENVSDFGLHRFDVLATDELHKLLLGLLKLANENGLTDAFSGFLLWLSASSEHSWTALLVGRDKITSRSSEHAPDVGAPADLDNDLGWLIELATQSNVVR